MPKASVQLTDAQFLAVMNRNLRIPGQVISVVQSAALRGLEVMEIEDTMILDSRWIVMVDFHPIVDPTDAFDFHVFAREVYGPNFNIAVVEDMDDYAVLENLLAAASHFNPYTFSWVE